jgi:hypothetical protein
MASKSRITYVDGTDRGYLQEMQRFALALIAAVVVVGLATVLLRSAARSIERVAGNEALSSGGTMQKAAFFLLLCLIMYVSISGAS